MASPLLPITTQASRERLEHLCRYVLRPPIAQDSLALSPGGRVVLTLRRPWRDGTRAVVFDPVDFLARLAALMPRPRINLLIYHGIFAPHAADRRAAVACGRRCGDDRDGSGTGRDAGRPSAGNPPEPTLEMRRGDARGPDLEPLTRPRRNGWIRWANLLRRVFEIDALECRRCGGRVRVVAAIDEPAVVHRILSHLGLPTELSRPLPARPPPASELSFGWE